jgi:hypothetical protein
MSTQIKWLLLATFALSVLTALPSCGGEVSAPPGGDLRVENAEFSTEMISSIRAFRTQQLFWPVGVSPGESHTIRNLEPGFYIVTITWDFDETDEYPDVQLISGQTTVLEVSR